MLQVTIKSTDTTVKEGIGKTSGKPYRIEEQSGYAHLFDESGKPKPYPTEVRITLPDGAKPYPVGEYVIGPESVRSGAYAQIEFGRLVLHPMPVKAK